jgi:hypothetical protein
MVTRQRWIAGCCWPACCRLTARLLVVSHIALLSFLRRADRLNTDHVKGEQCSITHLRYIMSAVQSMPSISLTHSDPPPDLDGLGAWPLRPLSYRRGSCAVRKIHQSCTLQTTARVFVASINLSILLRFPEPILETKPNSCSISALPG